MKHKPVVPVLSWIRVQGIPGPVPVYAKTCWECGRPVRRMTGLGGPDRTVFWHSSGKPGPDDPRRGPRSPEWAEAISRGMRTANERRSQRSR